MDLSFLAIYYPYFLSGVVITIVISIITVIFGTILGVIFALMKLSKVTPLRWFANAYIEVIRGTPMLVQILIAFGLLQGMFALPTVSIGVLSLDFGRLFPGIIALSLNSGAYVAEIVRGGINAVDYGQTEAAGSLGLRPFQTMRYVVLPQALRNILPPLGNEFIVLIGFLFAFNDRHLRADEQCADRCHQFFPTINAFLCGGGHLLHLDVYDFATIEFMGKETRQRLSSLKGEDKL